MVRRYVQFAAAISSIYKSIQKIERQEMERLGLRGPHVHCLVTVSDHPEGVPAAQLCELCERDKASISRSLSELERKGLVDRAPGYRGSVTLTAAGQAVVVQIRETARRAVEAVSLDLDEAHRTAFYQDLENIAKNLQYISKEGVSEE